MSDHNSALAKVTQKAATDPAFRESLKKDPRAALASELGVQVPQNIKIVVVEDSADTVHLVLPMAGGKRELSDADLEAVAGGVSWGCCGYSGGP